MTISLTGLQPSDLAPQVVLGYCDLDGASLRALTSLGAAAGCTSSYRALEVTGCSSSLAPACADQRTGSPCQGVASLVNVHRQGEASPQVSLLALNAAAPEDQQSYIVAELVRLVAAAQQLHPNSCLWVVASALLPQAKQQGVHVLATPGATQQPAVQLLAASCPAVPPGAALQDNTLALLHHMAVATGTRAAFLLAPGYRPPAGSDAAAESSAEAGKLVQALLPALGASSGGAQELLAVDAAAAQRLQLLQPWFWGSRRDATHDGMYC